MLHTSLDQRKLVLLIRVGLVLSGHQPASHQQFQPRLVVVLLELLQGLCVDRPFLFCGGDQQDERKQGQQLPRIHILNIIFNNVVVP